jgi:hypothetical protein
MLLPFTRTKRPRRDGGIEVLSSLKQVRDDLACLPGIHLAAMDLLIPPRQYITQQQ